MKNFIDKIRYKIGIFMNGRYGTDNLFIFLMWAVVVLILINVFARSAFISILEFVVIVCSLLRTISRNMTKRRAENNKYLEIKNGFTGFFKLKKDRFRDRKTHVYKKCPSCHTVLRFPRTPGNHTARCPKCDNRFDVNI